MSAIGLQTILERVRAEYVEMPGMRLTQRQVQRLCGMDASMCQAVLDALVDARFLRVSADGHYVRLSDRDLSGHRTADSAKT